MDTIENKYQLNYNYDWLSERQFKEEVEFVNYPFCNSDDYKIITHEKTVIGVVRCNICSLIYVNPRLKSPIGF